jgi:hypothetical protein
MPFKNSGNLKFDNVTEEWGFAEPTFSNGAICTDLDNDGDLDYVINNINDKALIYENTARDKKNRAANFLKIQFKGEKKNRQGIGALVEIHYGNGKVQVYENSPFRGYLSTVDATVFFWIR